MTGTLELLKAERRLLEELRMTLADTASPLLDVVEGNLDTVDGLLPEVEAVTAYVVDTGTTISICEAITGRLLADPVEYADGMSRRTAVANAVTVVGNTEPHEVIDRGRVISMGDGQCH